MPSVWLKLMDVHAKWVAALPNIQPFYAVECNDDVMVLKVLAAMGTGFDCSNINEVKTVLDLGVYADRIIYANTCRQVSHILWAKQNKVDLMTFDSDAELVKIQKHFPTASFHVRSLCMNPASYQDAVELAYRVFQYAGSVGYHMTLLDIGGGYHGRNDEQSSVLFERTAEHILKGLEKFEDMNDLKVIAEPGTFYPSSSYAVAVNIIGKRFMEKSDNGEPLVMYYVNDGTHGTFFPFNYTTMSLFISASTSEGFVGITKLKTVKGGQTCESIDKIRDCEMPELEVGGDWIYFDVVGA